MKALISSIFIAFLAVLCLEAKEISVFVSIEPQKFFVEQIAGKNVNVHTMVKSGASPATYEPSPRQMALLSESDVFFSIGVPFEKKLLPKLKDAAKRIKIINTASGIPLRRMDVSLMTSKSSASSQSGHLEKEGFDPHVWLNPNYVEIQAETIAKALINLDPEHAEQYRTNKVEFILELKKLDNDLKKIFAPVKGKIVMVFHPAWGYFTDAYGLKQFPVEIEGKEPKARQLAKIIEIARNEKIHIIFVQSQFSRRLAGKIADSIGGTVVAVNPLAFNYFTNLRNVAHTIYKALKEQK